MLERSDGDWAMPISNPKKGASDRQSESFPGARRNLRRDSRWGRCCSGSKRIDVDDEVWSVERDHAVQDQHDPEGGSAS
jgi:hypothetical protein